MQPWKSTKGWSLRIKWKDGRASWKRLANLKESNPLEVADYALVHSLEAKPAFAWWVPITFKQRNRIIASVNKKYHERGTHKFGIELLKTYNDCVRIDKKTATHSGKMPYTRKCRRYELRSKRWVTTNAPHQHSKRCVAILSTTSRWKTFSEKLA